MSLGSKARRLHHWHRQVGRDPEGNSVQLGASGEDGGCIEQKQEEARATTQVESVVSGGESPSFEASGLSDEELGAFMRREGLHEADLQEMRKAALAGLEPAVRSRGPSAEEKRIKTLEREVRRKEKALAEAGALLILKKKLNALMEEEGDDTDDTCGDDF